MKLCKDCKWCKQEKGFPWFSRLKWEYAKCQKTAEMTPERISPVDGHVTNPIRKMGDCSIARIFGPCGEHAKLFEPR